jgi:palmitoyltransferase
MELLTLLEERNSSDFIEKISSKDYYKKDISKINDNEGNTLLSKSILLNIPRISLFLIPQIKYYLDDTSTFISYINKKNKKGYNSILYSAFIGNIEIFDKLINNGGDIQSSNNNGLNILHMAAQGNHPNIIIYIIEKFCFNINSLDINGNNALHWSVYKNSFQIIDFLLYFGININQQEKEGFTPLHLAVLNKNLKMVKKLLFLKCNKNLLANNKKSAYQISKDEHLKEINNEIFKSKFSLEYSYIIFILFIIFTEIFNQFISLRYFRNIAYSFLYIFLFFILFLLLHIIMQSNPGEIEIRLVKPLIKICEEGESLRNICPWCLNYTNPFSKHCYICNKCINYIEFHSNCLNNCITKKNIGYYLQFFSYFSLYVGSKIFLNFFILYNGIQIRKHILLVGFHILLNCIIFAVLLRNIYLTKSNFISKKYSSFYEEDINYEEVTPENKTINDNKYYKEEISTLVVN